MPVLEFTGTIEKQGKKKGKHRFQILSISFHTETQEPVIDYKRYIRNRVIGKSFQDFVHVSFGNMHFQRYQKYGVREHIWDILVFGVMVNGIRYVFCGHTNSQLRSKACYLIREPLPSIPTTAFHNFVYHELTGMGDFDEISEVGKRSKRIGLLFSSADQIVFMHPLANTQVPDIVHNNLNFTDGCGLISVEFANSITRKHLERVGNFGCNTKYVPSVYQIRYKGYKGVLARHAKSELMNLAISHGQRENFDFIDLSVIFRDSMKKFNSCPKNELFLLDFSKPGAPARLNAELVSILSTLGVPDKIFRRKLREHFEFVRLAAVNADIAMKLIEFKGRLRVLQALQKHGFDQQELDRQRLIHNSWITRHIFFTQVDELTTFYGKGKKQKVSMMVQESRLLFGVSDHTGKLPEGQVMVKITTGRKTLKTKRILGRVLVGRNPCFHPGDIQEFTAIEGIPELDDLLDCLVFSTNGELPPASQMSGGDLDGDKFFVCWDPELFPPKFAKPVDYSLFQAKTNINFTSPHPQLDLIEYFCNYNTVNLSEINRLYNAWIRRTWDRAFSDQCVRLNELFCKAVDGEIVQVPNDLKFVRNMGKLPTFILDTLRRDIQTILLRDFPDHLADDTFKCTLNERGRVPKNWGQWDIDNLPYL